jgi:hypothetical protein
MSWNLDVAHTGSAPYCSWEICERMNFSTPCRLPVGDTAYCQSALQRKS